MVGLGATVLEERDGYTVLLRPGRPGLLRRRDPDRRALRARGAGRGRDLRVRRAHPRRAGRGRRVQGRPRARLGGRRRRQRRLPPGRDRQRDPRPRSPTKPDPISISAYYLSASTPGPAQVTTRVVREGGSVATVAADLVQDGQPRITALATYGDLGRLPDDVRTTAVEPVLPPPDECVPSNLAPPEVLDGAPAARPVRHAVRPRLRRLGGRGAERERDDPGVVPARRRPRARPDRAAAGRRRDAAGDVRPRDDGLGADPGADRSRARQAGSRAGSSCGTPPATWRAACSRRTARSGTPPAGWSRRAASSPGSPR